MTSLASHNRFVFVDALRGLAALGVVLFHAVEGQHITQLLNSLPHWLQTIIKQGSLGVAVFFVLSGFVIAHSLHKYRINSNFVGRFILRRSLRLDPPYWVAIVLTLGFGALATTFVDGRATDVHSVGQIVAHLFYLQDILGYQNINPVFWTLCLEVQFYLVYAALLLAGRNDPQAPFQGRRTAGLLLLAGLISLLWPLGLGPELPHGLFPPFWHGFLLGVGVYWATRDHGAILWLVLYSFIIGASAVAHGDSFSLTCVVTSVILFLVSIAGRLHTALNWRWLQFLGLISYSLYLIHNPITGASFRIGYLITNRTIYTEAIWWFASIAACITCAWFMWWAVERPSLLLARKVRFSKSAQ